MITVYYNLSNSSSRSALSWFENREIEVQSKKITRISRADLIQALSITDQGFSDILKENNRSSVSIQEMLEDIQEMSFREGIELIMKHPEILNVPPIFDETKLMTGYNSEEIRRFIPKSYRKSVKNQL